MAKTVYIGWRGVVALLREAGFSESKVLTFEEYGLRVSSLELAYCVVQGESAGDPYSTNYNGEGVPVTLAPGVSIKSGAVATTATTVMVGETPKKVVKGAKFPDGSITVTETVILPSPPKPALTWFPGGETHDCGIVQWNDYYWGADPDSPFHNPDRVKWYQDAYNPKVALSWMWEHTEGGVRNWSTWLAFTNESFAGFLDQAKRAIALPPVLPFRPLTIGGKSWVRASSIPARCNPGTGTARWFTFNKTVIGPPPRNEVISLEDDRSRLLQPGTTIRVPYWTTKIQAGPTLPEFARP